MKDIMIGRFAVSKAGRDTGNMYVVVDEKDGFLYLADGVFHTVKAPKKKNRKHTQMMNEVVQGNVPERLSKKETVFDHEIKYAIKIRRKEEGYV